MIQKLQSYLGLNNPMKIKIKKLNFKNRLLRKNVIFYRIFFYLMFLTIFLFNCSFPRIIVLDDPLSPEEHLNLGVVYEKKGELDSALKEYKLASKRIPLAYLYMGNVYFQKKEYKKAEKNYREAIKSDPQNADAYNNLAWLYYIIGENIDEAERLALKAMELNPAKHDVYKDTLERIRNFQKF